MLDHRPAGIAFPDVVGRVGRTRDVVLLDDASAAVLRVDPVALHVPDGQVPRSEAVGAVPVEDVAEVRVGGEVLDRDPVRLDVDRVVGTPAAVEDDGIPVGASEVSRLDWAA